VNINATLFLQALVFALLVWFTMRFVWPPLARALDERAQQVASGLAAAQAAQTGLLSAQQEGQLILNQAKEDAQAKLNEAVRRAQALLDEAQTKAQQQAQRIIEEAKLDTQQQLARARETLRQEVAVLVVQGAEQILRREIDPAAHAQLLSQLQAKL
jgi:F-type H+-transporting ATPase subunit b